jgi:hypothetical protein
LASCLLVASARASSPSEVAGVGKEKDFRPPYPRRRAVSWGPFCTLKPIPREEAVLSNAFREFQEGLAILQDRIDNLASFLGTKVRYLEEELHYLRSVLEGQRIERAREDAFQG